MQDSKLFLNVKFLSKREFFSEYLFKYDEKTIYYLTQKYNYKVSIAKSFLDNMLCLDNEKKNSAKLQFLIKLKQELNENKLLIYNKLFITYYINISLRNLKK